MILDHPAISRTVYGGLGRIGFHVAAGLHPMYALLKALNISKVLDVGANEGQFARRLRIVGYQGPIISFEPVSSAFAILSGKARRDRQWETVHCAVGDFDGEVAINVSQSTNLSSILPRTPFLAENYPTSQYVTSTQVPIVRLDSVVPKYVNPQDRLMLKIDTQGYERQVLDGAGEVFENIHAVYLELSFRALYEGETLFADIMDRLRTRGFTLVHLEPLYHSLERGEISQADGFFARL